MKFLKPLLVNEKKIFYDIELKNCFNQTDTKKEKSSITPSFWGERFVHFGNNLLSSSNSILSTVLSDSIFAILSAYNLF